MFIWESLQDSCECLVWIPRTRTVPLPKDLIKIGAEENRIVLSRAASLSKKNSTGHFIIIDKNPILQLKQVVAYFNLKNEVNPFSRCNVCNGELEKVQKEEIDIQLQQNADAYFNEFWQCDSCKRIYWKGSHYERMLKTIEPLIH